jgi:hypothetical protein
VPSKDGLTGITRYIPNIFTCTMAIKRGWIHDELSFTTHLFLVCREQRI